MKKYLAMAALVLTAVCSHGYYMRWDVEFPAFGSTGDDSYYACLVAVNSSGDTYYLSDKYALDANGKTSAQRTLLEEDMRAYDPGSDLTSSSDDTWGALVGDNMDWSDYSFHVLVVDSNNNQVFSSESYSTGSKNWASLIADSNVRDGGRNLITWHVTPEPSCALLFGIGAALMAIRRRKA
ncbi:MAG: PEP-CTERM sorting domain-containing protein [Kiritimatiellae bacterium]|nr:PEP-CTERM sorting domain-containing protein [Kiritimatiellia bacterium]